MSKQRDVSLQLHQLDSSSMMIRDGIPRVISVTSGKGGVGKTNTAVNLAIALANRAQRVLLVDCDLGLANVDVMFGISPSRTLEDVIFSGLSMSEAITETPHGVSIISASSGADCMVSLSTPERYQICEQIEEVARGYDYLIIDTPAGIGPDVIYFNAVSSEVMVVITPEPTSMADAYALIKLLVTRHGECKISLLVNNVTSFDEEADAVALRAASRLIASCEKFLHLHVNYLGFVPHDPTVPKAISKNRPLLEIFPGSKAGLCLSRIAKRVDETSGEQRVRGGLQLFFSDILNRQLSL